MLELNARVDLGDDVGIVEAVRDDGVAVVSSLVTGRLLELPLEGARLAASGPRVPKPSERAIGLWHALVSPDDIQATIVAEYGQRALESAWTALECHAQAQMAEGDPGPGDPVAFRDGRHIVTGIALLSAPGRRLHVAWDLGDGRASVEVVPIERLDLTHTYRLRAIRSMRWAIDTLMGVTAQKRRKPSDPDPGAPDYSTDVYLTQRPPKTTTHLEPEQYPALEALRNLEEEAAMAVGIVVEYEAELQRLEAQAKALKAKIDEAVAKMPEHKELVDTKMQRGKISDQFATSAKACHEILQQELAAIGDVREGVLAKMEADLKLTGKAAKEGYNQFLVYYRRGLVQEEIGSVEGLAIVREFATMLGEAHPRWRAEIADMVEKWWKANSGVRETVESVLAVGVITPEYRDTTKVEPAPPEEAAPQRPSISPTGQDLSVVLRKIQTLVRAAWTGFIDALHATRAATQSLRSGAEQVERGAPQVQQAITGMMASLR